MLIAVVIVGALVVYAWVMGYIRFSSEEMGEAIKIASLANDPEDVDLLVYVQNVGDETVQLEEAGCLYVNGKLVACTITGVTVSEGVATLGHGDTAVLRYSGGAALPDEKVTVKVTTVRGTTAEKSGYPAGAAYIPPALNHFTFDVIESPQTSGRPFDVTVWAVDQYDNVFVGYSGSNTLTISGGEISPSTTGNFVDGVWSGTVTVTGSATDTSITAVAQSNSSWTGTSNPFEVIRIEPITLWNQTYGGGGTEYVYAMVGTADGGFALAGYTDSFGAGGDDFWLVKTDENGNMEWNRTYGGTLNDIAYSVVETSDGGYAIAGVTNGSEDNSGGDFWLVKTDENGTMEWNRTYGSGRAYSVIETDDEGYAIAGWIDDSGSGGTGFWVVKTDIVGDVEWRQRYGEGGWAQSIIEVPDEGYVISGWTNLAGEDGAFLVKTDLSGNLDWNRTYQITYMDSQDRVNSLIATSDGGYMLAGRTHGGFFIWRVIKVDQYGFEEWRRTFGEQSPDPRVYPNADEAQSVVETPDGGYLIAGYTYDWVWRSGDDWVIKLDGYGNMQWNQTYGETGSGNHDSAHAIVATSDGGYAIAGCTASYGAGGYDFWLIKIDGYGRVP